MRVTKRQLKRIIREEKAKALTKQKIRRIVRETINEAGFSDLDIEAMEQGTGRYADRASTRRTVLIDDGEGGMADSSPQFGYFTRTKERVMWRDLGLSDSAWRETDAIRSGLKALGATHVEDPNNDEPTADWPTYPIDEWV